MRNVICKKYHAICLRFCLSVFGLVLACIVPGQAYASYAEIQEITLPDDSTYQNEACYVKQFQIQNNSMYLLLEVEQEDCHVEINKQTKRVLNVYDKTPLQIFNDVKMSGFYVERTNALWINTNNPQSGDQCM